MVPGIRGISYAIGDGDEAVLRHDMRAIRDELHCTTVMLIDTDTVGHLTAAEIALEAGLDVYIRPYCADRPWADVLAHVGATAAAAEELRARYPGRVTLLIGCEFSLTTRGIIPGRWLFLRLQVLIRWGRYFERRITRRLGRLIVKALATARGEFRGPITYAAGYWEEVDWSGFDLVGVNLYRLGDDAAAYEQKLDALLDDANRPVVITEFGCGAHVGADRRGPGSFLIVNWFSDPPRVKAGHVRDEATQAAYLTELIDLYTARDVHGCFVYTFLMPDFPYHEDPRRDLDMAGFGVVRATPDGPERWQRKEAFEAVASRYAALSRR